MSEGSSVLLNMGAEVATTPGANPVIPAQTAQSADSKDGFAAALQAVMSAKTQAAEEAPIITSDINTNPLLFTQSGEASDEFLKQNGLALEILSGGKDLPPEEQEIAWQSVLSEYDSADPETPRLVIASGDENGYAVEELTAEQLRALAQTGDIQHKAETQTDKIPLHEVDTKSVTDNKPSPEHLVSGAVLNEQSDIKKPASGLPVAGNEAIGNISKPGLADGGQSHGNSLHKQDSADSKQALASSQKTDEMSGTELEHFKSELAKESSVKQEITSLSESMTNKATQSISSSSTNSAALGTSAYSAVSSLNAVGASGQSSSTPVLANMTIPPQNPAWGDIVGDRVQWMVTQNIQEAKIRLNPAELGMLEVRVQVGNDQQTSISFTSPHSQVRDALETAIPRLREMFGESGLTLGNVDVSHQSMSGQTQQGQDDDKPGHSSASSSNPTNESATVAAPQAYTSSGTGMLDLYA